MYVLCCGKGIVYVLATVICYKVNVFVGEL